MKQVKSQPLGVMPRWRWLEVRHRFPPHRRDRIRTQALLDAVFRHRAAGLEPPAAWSREFAEILTRNLP